MKEFLTAAEFSSLQRVSDFLEDNSITLLKNEEVKNYERVREASKMALSLCKL